MSKEPRRDGYYGIVYFAQGREREAEGTYAGLSTWTDLPEHKYGSAVPDAGPDVEHHWFRLPEGLGVLSILPENLIEVSERTPPPRY